MHQLEQFNRIQTAYGLRPIKAKKSCRPTNYAHAHREEIPLPAGSEWRFIPVCQIGNQRPSAVAFRVFAALQLPWWFNTPQENKYLDKVFEKLNGEKRPHPEVSGWEEVLEQTGLGDPSKTLDQALYLRVKVQAMFVGPAPYGIESGRWLEDIRRRHLTPTVRSEHTPAWADCLVWDRAGVVEVLSQNHWEKNWRVIQENTLLTWK